MRAHGLSTKSGIRVYVANLELRVYMRLITLLKQTDRFLFRVYRVNPNRVLGCKDLSTLVALQRFPRRKYCIRIELSIQAPILQREVISAITTSQAPLCGCPFEWLP